MSVVFNPLILSGFDMIGVTTSTGGITSLNAQTGASQTFAIPGTSGTAPAWVSASDIHTLNIPLASASSVTAGLLSNADYSTFTTTSANNTVDVTIAAFGSSPDAKGITISGQAIALQPADATHPGAITTGTQSFAGAKTFTGAISASNLSGTNSGDITLAAVGSSPSANAATLSSQVLTIQPADATHPGVVTSGTQTIGGAKTFSSTIAASNLSGTNTGDVTVGAFGSSPDAKGITISSQAITLQPADISNPGALSIVSQTIAGAKTFTSALQATQIGIGTAAGANTPLDIVVDTSATSQSVILTGYGINGTTFRTRNARGTSGSPTASQSGDKLASFGGLGYGATGFSAVNTGSYRVVANENFTDSAMGTYLGLFTTPAGSITSAESVRINSTGNMLIGTTSDDTTSKLQVNGIAKATSYTLSGTAGTGFYELTTQSSAPSTPSSNNIRLYSNAGVFAWKGSNGFVRSFDGTANTADQTYTLPNVTGTVQAISVSAISSNTTAVSGKTYNCDTSGGVFNLTLPAPALNAIIRVKDSKGTFNTNNLTVVRNGSEKIEGVAASKTLASSWSFIGFYSDGVDWFMA